MRVKWERAKNGTRQSAIVGKRLVTVSQEPGTSEWRVGVWINQRRWWTYFRSERAAKRAAVAMARRLGGE